MKSPKTVVLTAPEPEMDPHLLLLDGSDIRAVNRHERRKHGFRGPAFTQPAPSLTRFVRRHGQVILAGPPRTRRQRKAKARCVRAISKRGLS